MVTFHIIPLNLQVNELKVTASRMELKTGSNALFSSWQFHVSLLLASGMLLFQFLLWISYYFSCILRLNCSSKISEIFGGTVIILSNCITSSFFLSALNLSNTSILNDDLAVHLDILLCTSLCIVVVFLISGGKLSQLTPSHTAYPGSFARSYVFLNNKGASPSPSMKQKIQNIGKKYGCHHCGSFVKHYISDHMPPTVLYKSCQEMQLLYPQCKDCSSFQGGVLSKRRKFPLFSKHGIIFYPWKAKRWLIWFPYYLAIDITFNASANVS